MPDPQPPRMRRLANRTLSIRSRAYLVYRALWPAIEEAVRATMAPLQNRRDVVVIDIGCGEKPYQDLFGDAHYVGLNYSGDGASPDVLGDAQSLPFADRCADVVFTTQVIEHLPDPRLMLAEAWRVLKPGGTLILTGPFYWPLHEEPYDFFRFTHHGFRVLLQQAGFTDIVIRGDCGTLTQVAVSVIELLPRWLVPLVPVINVLAPLAQRLSRDERSTLNYLALARRP